MDWDTLQNELVRRVPALKPRLEEEKARWAPDQPGHDIIFGDLFVPYLLGLLEEPDLHADELVRSFALVEELASDSDERVVGVAVVSILEALEDHPELLNRADRWLGSSTRDKLPTRQWLERQAEGSQG